MQPLATDLITRTGVWSALPLTIVSSVMSASDDKKKALEDAAEKHFRVVQADKVSFSYRRTAPSGPPPATTQRDRSQKRPA